MLLNMIQTANEIAYLHSLPNLANKTFVIMHHRKVERIEEKRRKED